MARNRKRSGKKVKSSFIGELEIKGTLEYILKTHEDLAEKAQTEGNLGERELHLQYADHYRRVLVSAQENKEANNNG